MSTVVCVLGSYGEFVGSHIAKQCVVRPNLITKILVRPGYDSDAEKKRKVDELVSLGAIIVFGDAADVNTLIPAFDGVDIVLSALGGWGAVDKFHDKYFVSSCGRYG